MYWQFRFACDCTDRKLENGLSLEFDRVSYLVRVSFLWNQASDLLLVALEFIVFKRTVYRSIFCCRITIINFHQRYLPLYS